MNEHCEGICPSDLTVMLTKPLDLRRLQSELRDVPQKVGIKPRGFWFACGDEWINLVRGQWDMAEKFDGVIICPFQASVRYSLDWYLPWDVASGCVWRREAIAGVSNISNKANPR